ncbi:MAG: SRPBCC family protein [Solirubrobacterales bacterium]|nr:SRPBCC family protein [Solirubrobacterales bacterium]HMT05991.1 SRPBCC family protein [Solirubrobacterales bacterium]
MPTVTRKTNVAASPDLVYDLISDPARMDEWWPRVLRVEDIAGKPGTERTRWTSVLGAESGRRLRLDYRCTGATRPVRYDWEHELEATPYAEHLTEQSFSIRIEPQGEGSEVTLTTVNTLRGSARLAGFTMKKGQKSLIDTALQALAGAFGEDGH